MRPATYMQDFGPGDAPVSDCTAPSCAAPGSYGFDQAKPAAPPASFMAAMHHMHMSMPKPTGDVDHDFLAGMIPHHQAAVDMAALEIKRGHDPRLVALAQTIIASQSREILAMRQLLRQLPATHSDASATAFPAIMHHIHAAMVHDSGDIDLDFVRGMLPHHQAAIDMAQVIVDHGRDPYVRRLALDILAAQQGEVSWMNAWLQQRQP